MLLVLAVLVMAVGVVLQVRSAAKYGPEEARRLHPRTPPGRGIPLSEHVADPEHPEDRDWGASEPDPRAP